MRIYKIKFIPIEFFPFKFLYRWGLKIKLLLKKRKLKRKFKKLNWSEAEVWELTKFSDSLNEAVHTLCLKLTNNRCLFDFAKKLINDGFEREWE